MKTKNHKNKALSSTKLILKEVMNNLPALVLDDLTQITQKHLRIKYLSYSPVKQACSF